MRRLRHSLVAILLPSLFGCTQYAERGSGIGLIGGHSTTQLAENVFQVRFGGNAFTSSERAEDFALLRAAEAALEHGYKYFVIVDSSSEIDVSTHTVYPSSEQTSFSGNITGNQVHGSATTMRTPAKTYEYHKPRASTTIFCFVDKPEGFAFDAEFLRSSLREKYGMDSIKTE